MTASKSKDAIVGYKYHVGMHMVLCREMDELVQILVGERVLWSRIPGSPSNPSGERITSTKLRHVIDQPNFWGGSKREGGMTGEIDILFGGAGQGINPYLFDRLKLYASPSSAMVSASDSLAAETVHADALPTLATESMESTLSGITPQDAQLIGIPAFRGMVSIILRNFCYGLNPYLKPWAFRVTRNSPIPAGYPANLNNFPNGGTNAALMIRECLTHPEWGMGYPPAGFINDNNFIFVANTLLNEGFGLSLTWDAQSPVEDLIQEILDHINGVLRTNKQTGEFELKLIRGDYLDDPSALPEFDESNIVEVQSFQRIGWGETTNEVVVRYMGPNGQMMPAPPAQNLANIHIQGAIVSQTKDYRGVPDGPLATKLASRDLMQLSAPLASISFVANRSAWNVRHGDVIRVSWDKLGLNRVFIRVASVDTGTLQDGKIVITGIEDIFAYSFNQYDPIVQASPYYVEQTLAGATDSPRVALLEAPYWIIARRIGDKAAAELDLLSGYLLIAAQKPAPSVFGYDVDFVTEDTTSSPVSGEWAPNCTTGEALLKEVHSHISITWGLGMRNVEVGDYGLIDDEFVQVAAVTDTTITLHRGMLDTVPAAHASGSTILFVGTTQGWDETERISGETVTVKLLTNAGQGQLAAADATAHSLTFDNRAARPLPPGNLLVNDDSYPTEVTGNLVISWSHRNRKWTTKRMTRQTDEDVSNEPGVKYRVQLRDQAGVVFQTLDDISGTSVTVTTAQEISWRGALCTTIDIRVWAKRDEAVDGTPTTFFSWQPQRVVATRS